jgi:hypothetical protein
MNDILKMKIVRDINRIFNTPSPNSLSKYPRFMSEYNYSQKYINLLTLINNTAWSNVVYSLKINKMLYSELDNMDLDFIEEIVNKKNIRIVETPKFVITNIDKTGKIITNFFSVSNYVYLPTLEYLKNNSNYIFYIYVMDRYKARWFMYEDEKFLIRIRKAKIEKLNALSF